MSRSWSRPSRRTVAWLCGAALLGLGACADDSLLGANGQAGSAASGAGGGGGAGGCSSTAPAAPDGLQCADWSCSPVAAPECWQCAPLPWADGASCSSAELPAGMCVAGVCQPVPDPGEPHGTASPPGSYELVLQGNLAGTTLPLTIYLPADAGSFPVVVFHHGFQLGTELYASYGGHWASWGYVVVMPQMPGGLVGGPTHLELKQYLVALLDWIEATGAAVDGPLAGKADVTRIALAGHSLGGKISLLTATDDPRPLAVFGVDPVDASGSPFPVSEVDYPSVTPELMGLITVPLGLLGETTNATCSGIGCQACAPAADNFQQYYQFATSPAQQLEILGASHMSFLDDPNCGLTCSVCPAGSDDPATTRRLTRRYMTAFFNVVLKQEGAYRSYLTGPAMAADVAAALTVTESKNGW
jgi:chlorophyllase